MKTAKDPSVVPMPRAGKSIWPKTERWLAGLFKLLPHQSYDQHETVKHGSACDRLLVPGAKERRPMAGLRFLVTAE